MTQTFELPLLSSWQNFYMIMGTAAATLTGLMFVATTIIAGIDTHVPTANAGVAAFNTPTVVHFCAVLLLAGILSAPWPAFSGLSTLICVFGLGMAFYLIIVMRRMQRMPHYQSTLEDWLWYMVLPLLAHILLIAAAMMLKASPAPSLYMVGAAMAMLLLIGIRNAWDNMTYLAIERAHSENKTTEQRQATRKK
jgi:hypothetical protein